MARHRRVVLLSCRLHKPARLKEHVAAALINRDAAVCLLTNYDSRLSNLLLTVGLACPVSMTGRLH